MSVQYVHAESVKLVFSGKNYFEMLEKIIDEAKETIHLQTYIFENDNTGKKIADALIRASRREVKVFVLADAFGSNSLPRKFIDNLRKEKINFRFFSPLFSSEGIFFGRRLHHKIVVADKHIALVGGINIADKYYGTQNENAWFDHAVLVQGKACVWLHNLCAQIFEKRKLKTLTERGSEKEKFHGKILVRFIRNDWVRRKNEIHKSYIDAISKSEKSVIMTASYFLPGFRLRREIKKAGKRGVDVRIILAGKSDVPFFRLAEKYLYQFLLENNVKIYEWKNSVMHGKAITIDNEWSSVGSFNLNHLSRYRSIELNVDVMDKNFSSHFSCHLKEVMSNDCAEITKNNFFKWNSGLLKAKSVAAYFLLRTLMKFFLSKKYH